MTEYVPYEERVRSEHAATAASAAASHAAQAAAVTDVSELLAQLGGRGTDSYIEVLKPAGRRDRWWNRDTLIVLPGRTGGPCFVIDEVLEAYRVLGAVTHRYKDGGSTMFDVLVVPDRRLWLHAGGGVTPNTWQLLASSVLSVDRFQTAGLERIAADLRSRLP